MKTKSLSVLTVSVFVFSSIMSAVNFESMFAQDSPTKTLIEIPTSTQTNTPQQ
jgi:hypothetical protein